MSPDLLPLLACPICGGDLRLDHPRRLEEAEGGAIREGLLCCAGCGRAWPLRNGIPRFVEAAESPDPRFRETAARFAEQWTRFQDVFGVERDLFALHFPEMFPPERLSGRRVLDAGCGSGRFSAAARSYGARVIGLDGSAAVDSARTFYGEHPDLQWVQADLLRPPFRPGGARNSRQSFPITWEETSASSMWIATTP